MNKRNTFVAVRFQAKDGTAKSARAMDYCLCKDGRNRVSGRLEFSPRNGSGDRPDETRFSRVFQKWHADTFAAWELPKGRLPVVIGWGARDREILDELLVDDAMTAVTQAFAYLDVKACAVCGDKIRGVKASDGWKKIASKCNLLDRQYADLDEPTPRAIVEMFFALENSGDSAIISKAFLDIVKVIMADGKVTTDEVRLLRSFISTLLNKHPRFEGLAALLDEVLEDNVVDRRESKQLMKVLGDMTADFGGQKGD